jgi:hypothetical protein
MVAPPQTAKNSKFCGMAQEVERPQLIRLGDGCQPEVTGLFYFLSLG